jgi:hypothetical protein
MAATLSRTYPIAGILLSEVGMVIEDLQRHQLEDTKDGTQAL